MTTLTEKELIALIRSSRPQDKAVLAEFLDAAPTMIANNLLYEIAAAKTPARITGKGWVLFVYLVLMPIWSVLATIENLHKGRSWWDSLLNTGTVHTLLVVCAVVSAWEKVKQYRGTEEALFLLTARNDSRALSLSIHHWRREPADSAKAWNDRIEAEATRLLDEKKSGTTSIEWQRMRKVVMQIMQVRRKRAKGGLKDITPGQAYFAAAIMRVLARAGGAENGQLLKVVSELPADAERFPNRTLVIEAAHIYYGAPDTLAPVTPLLTVTTPTTSPLQTLHRP